MTNYMCVSLAAVIMLLGSSTQMIHAVTEGLSTRTDTPCQIHVETPGGATVLPGTEDYLVTVDLENAVPVNGIQFRLSYDPDVLTLVDIERTSRAEHMAPMMWNQPQPGIVAVAMADFPNSVAAGEGPVFQFSFDVHPDAPAGHYPLVLSDVALSDEMGNDLSVEWTDGAVTVGPILLSVQGATVEPGSYDNHITVDMANSIPVNGLQFRLSYDPDVLALIDVVPTPRADHMSSTAWNEPEPGVVAVALFDVPTAIYAGDGPVFEFSFDVVPEAYPGHYPLLLSEVALSDDTGTDLPVEWTDGVVTIPGEYVKGDVDGSETIDILDVLTLVNHILGVQLLEVDALGRADCNGDSGVDILDALGIVNVILGIGVCGP